MSIDLFRDAIRKQPSFALAYAAIAESLVILIRYQYQRHRIPEARAAALRALELDDSLTEAQVSLASILVIEWEWAEAAKILLTAIAANPNDAPARLLYGALL